MMWVRERALGPARTRSSGIRDRCPPARSRHLSLAHRCDRAGQSGWRLSRWAVRHERARGRARGMVLFYGHRAWSLVVLALLHPALTGAATAKREHSLGCVAGGALAREAGYRLASRSLAAELGR